MRLIKLGSAYIHLSNAVLPNGIDSQLDFWVSGRVCVNGGETKCARFADMMR